MHRDGLKPGDVSVKLMGEGASDLTLSMKRFFEEVEVLGGDDSAMHGLKLIYE